MKKNTLLLLCFCALSLNLIAQLDRPHFVSLNVGTNIPLGDYENADSLAIGGADNGVYYSFETGLYFSKFVGLGINIGAFTNPVNEQDIRSQLEEDFGSNGEYQINSTDWVNGYAMLGPIFTFGSDKIRLDVKILAGLLNSQKPLVDVRTDNSGQVTATKSEEEINANFGINYGMHLRVQLIKGLGLRLNAEGFSSEQEFESKIERDANGSPIVSTANLKQQIQALNLGAGLVYTF